VLPLGERVPYRLLQRQAHEVRGDPAPLVRALVAGRYGGRTSVPPEELAKARALLSLIADWLLDCRDEIRHPQPRTAVAVALHFSISSLQLALLYDDAAASLTPDALVAELSQAVLAYLTSPHPTLPGVTR
jgi:hypothetical protein